MNWKENYNKWKQFNDLDDELKFQLEELEINQKQLEDSFYKTLEFGTGGIRGELGPGTNRMNIYTIRKASEGLARYIEEYGEDAKNRGVVIAFDSRHKSHDFAIEAAKTLGQHGIRTYVFESLRSTPELSFAVRYLNAYNGIVITASHNPPEYNGYKVYGNDGAQVNTKVSEEIISKVNGVENELIIKVKNEEELKELKLLTIIGEEIDNAYLERLKTVNINIEVIKQVADDLKIVYTPLHGTGNRPVKKGLEQIGFKNVEIVREQQLPDSNFSTVKSPNPEEHEAFKLAIKYGQENDADILLSTDPDADRVGVAVRNLEGEYQVLTGNQVGALLLNYLISQKQDTLNKDLVVLKTIVTSEIGRDIAFANNIRTIDTLTGFKFIGEKIREFEKTEVNFLFGYEESYGYLINDFVRDKDAIQACMLIAEVSAYYKLRNMTLYEGLLEIFKKYGYYQEGLESLTLKGKDGVRQIESIMSNFRINPLMEINKKRVIIIEDYKIGIRFYIKDSKNENIKLPKSNVIKYKLEDDSWFCLRPSGTEPKIKFYFGVKGSSLEGSKQKLDELKDGVMKIVYNQSK